MLLGVGGIHVLVSIVTSKICDVILFDDVTIQCTLNYALAFVLAKPQISNIIDIVRGLWPP